MAGTDKLLAFCSDHAGFDIKSALLAYAQKRGYAVKDFGTYSHESCDYPDFAHPMARAIEQGEHDLGIAVCGSGVGISITLNKHQGIRAGLAWLPEVGELTRRHNDANILVLPGRYVTVEEAEEIFDAFMNASFEGGRHQRRVDKIPL